MSDDVKFLSPEIITFPSDSVWGTISHNLFDETKMGLKMPVQYSAMMLLKKGDDGKYVVPIDPAVLFDKNLVAQISSVKDVVKTASESAERLFDQLRDLNNRLCRIDSIANIRDNFLKKVERSYEKLDFMGHRYLLGEIMKSAKIKCFEEVIGKDNFKQFRKKLEQFIFDRNKYTHGEVIFYVDESVTVLSYVNNATQQPEYGRIDNSIVDSYFRVQEYFHHTIAKIFVCLDNI